ncbi:MAG: DUF1844 domain-containing protein [Planctomycetota bacterium]
MADEDQKLQIDDDWKSEAAAEKERLSESAETAEAAGPAGIPEADFIGLIQILAMQAMVGLGGMAGPGGQEIPPNLDLAKHYVDLLEVLDKKTAGNLTPEEKRQLDTSLHQLRMAYVELVQRGGSIPPPPPGAVG